jgi:PKD repeat protein
MTTIADFSADTLTGDAPLTVDFTDESTGDPPTSWLWNFGDGSFLGEEQNPVHVYSTAGSYNVQLIVENDSGADSETKAGYITVNEPAPPPPPPPADPPIQHGAVVLGRTAQEVADFIVATPEWNFSRDPMIAIGFASTSAAQAALQGRRKRGDFYTALLAILLAAQEDAIPGSTAGGNSVLVGMLSDRGGVTPGPDTRAV